MRSISSILISFVCFYMSIHIKPNPDENRIAIGFFVLLSWIFLVISIIFMALGI